MGFCSLGGAVLAAEQCGGGCAGGPGAGRACLGRECRAGGQPGNAVDGVAFRSRSCHFSNLGKLQVTNPAGTCLGAALQGCGVLHRWGDALNPPALLLGFLSLSGSGKGTFHIPPKLVWPQSAGLLCLISLKITKHQFQAVNGGVV